MIDRIKYNGVEYSITDNVYSFEEQVIGVFIIEDGTEMPMYRKMYRVPAISAGGTWSEALPANINEILNLQGIITMEDGATTLLPIVNNSDVKFQSAFYTDGTNICVSNGTYRVTIKGHVTIEYTKTTD